MVRAIREVLDEADLPRDERTFRLDRLAEAMDVVSDVVAPYLGTSLVPRLQTCRNSLDPWRRAVEEGIADWKRNFWDRRLEDLRVSCQDDRGRWMGDCLVAARRSQEPLSGLLGSPNQVQVVGRAARLLDAALEAQVPREASEALERGRELVRLAAELERARRLEIDRDAADAIESVIERAMELDPTVPVADQAAEKRIFAITVPEKLAIVLVSIDAVTPLTSETWTRLSSNPAQLQRAIAQDLAPLDPFEMFSLDALKERHAFELSRASTLEDEFETEDTPAEPAS